MDILAAIILGLVEGVTEFVPVSSTGHLILAAALLGLDEHKSQIDAFNIMIQGGAILAVAGVFWPRIVQMLKGLAGRDPAGLRLFVNLVIAFLPAAVFGVLLNDLIEQYLFYPGPVVAALFLGGVALLFMRKWQKRLLRSQAHGDDTAENADEDHANTNGNGTEYLDIEHLTWKQALMIGLLQCVAMWPGTSRSMMTIIGGMLVGMRPKHAAEFSFLLGLPTLGGACVYKAYTNFMVDDTNVLESLGVVPVLVGLIAAMIAAGLSVKWLIAYLSKHGLALFGWYRIALSIVVVVFILAGWLQIQPPAGETPDGARVTHTD